MKLIDQSVRQIQQEDGLAGLYRHIETCGRVCYLSEPKGDEDSAKKFVDMLIKHGHTSVLEHGTVYMSYKANLSNNLVGFFSDKYDNNPYSIVKVHGKTVFVTTNYRVMVENGWLDDLQYMCSPTEWHEKRYTVIGTTDRTISHEIVRHRKMSFSQESQRYIAYDNGKEGKELTFIKPWWYDDAPASKKEELETMLRQCENNYFLMMKRGFKAEDARYILPGGTKTNIAITGFESDWKHFLNLRFYEKTGKVHPQMKNFSQKIEEILGNKKKK